MPTPGKVRLSARGLRAELGARNLQHGAHLQHEVTYGTVPSVVYAEDGEGGHGNFLSASYRRILAKPQWAARLEKTYTGAARLPRSQDRWRSELDCAGSSDALLMNVFCYPGVLRRPAVCACLGLSGRLQPDFGVRAELTMRSGEIDRTELDMVLGEVLVEAKLTEGGFGRASRERLLRYERAEETFSLQQLPQSGGQFAGYQIIRGILAAMQQEGRYLVLLDSRRADLQEICYRVLQAVQSAEAASSFRLVTWQELACTLPRSVQAFLEVKYGIQASR